MIRFTNRFWLLIATVSLVGLTTGCFQAASGEPDAPPPAAVGQASSPTPDIPTEAPEVATDVPTQQVEPTMDDAQLMPATETPLPVPTATPTATLAVAAAGTATAAQGDLQGLPPEQAIDPNDTPAAPFVETLSPARQTATAIINADATANAELTLGSPGQATNVFPIVTSTPFGADDGGFIPTATPLVPVATQPPVAGGGSGQCIHTVAPGDNLFRISLRYDVPIETIAAANPTKISTINVIVVGDQLVIPGCTTGGTTNPPPTSGNCNPSVPGSYRFVHTVSQYETLFQLSLQYNSPVASIAACNNIPNINLIYINQTLYIP